MKNKNIVSTIEAVEDIRKYILENREMGIDIDDIFSPEEAQELLKRLEDKRRVENMIEALSFADKTKSVNKFMETVKRKKKRKLISLVISTSVAASIIFGIVMLLDFDDKREIESYIVESRNDIQVTVPTLITGTGESINLEKLTDSIETSNYSLSNDNTMVEYKSKVGEQVLYNTFIVPANSRHSIKLSDGTEVTLNAGSKLIYPTSFNDSIRGVEFSGEAYFNVKKSDKPFVVNMNNIYVKVYGTEFNINTQQGDVVETVLVSGSVGMGNIDLNNEMTLLPNQRISYNLISDKGSVYSVASSDYMSWREDLFLYKERPIVAILSDIMAWYGVEFDLKKDNDLALTLRMSRKTELEDMLKIIEQAADVKFIKQSKNRYIME